MTVTINTYHTQPVNLWAETFGDKNHPTVLLMMGIGAQGLFWHDSFCQQLAAQGFYVIRFDYRDVGLSPSYDFNEQPYELNALVVDTIHLLEMLKINQVHLVGTSMGGFLAQMIAIDYPAMVKSVTLIASTPDLLPIIYPLSSPEKLANHLPLPTKEAMKVVAAASSIMASLPILSMIKTFAIKKVLSALKVISGKEKFNEEFYAELLKRSIERSPKARPVNHLKAMKYTETDKLTLTSRLNKIKAPILVIHGDSDPFFSLAHANAIIHANPLAKLVIIKGMGHLFHPYSEQILPAIITFLNAN